MSGATPKIVLSIVGGALLLVGVIDKRQSDALATALLTLGSGFVVLGVLLQRIATMRVGPGGFHITLTESSPAGEPEPEGEPRAEQRSGERTKPRRPVVVAAAIAASLLLLVAGAAARSALVDNYRVPGVDPRAEPCSWTLKASPREGVRRARIPNVLRLSPEGATRRLQQARFTVTRSGTVSGECVTSSQSRRAGRRLAAGRTMTVRLKAKPAGEALPPAAPPDHDADNDGFNAKSGGGTDCDDHDRSIHPDAVERSGDDIDQDCDGHVDPPEGVDGDGDGHDSRGDCNDANDHVYPGAPGEEAGDGVDTDCDGSDDPTVPGETNGERPPPPVDCGEADPANLPEECDGA